VKKNRGGENKRQNERHISRGGRKHCAWRENIWLASYGGGWRNVIFSFANGYSSGGWRTCSQISAWPLSAATFGWPESGVAS